MRLNQLEYVLNVLLPLDRRGSATIARTMYQETAESQQRREARQLQLAAERASFPFSEGRPTKKARRDIDRFRHGQD